MSLKAVNAFIFNWAILIFKHVILTVIKFPIDLGCYCAHKCLLWSYLFCDYTIIKWYYNFVELIQMTTYGMDGNFLIEDEMEVVKFVSKRLLYEHGSDMLRRIWDLVSGLIPCKTLMNIYIPSLSSGTKIIYQI